MKLSKGYGNMYAIWQSKFYGRTLYDSRKSTWTFSYLPGINDFYNLGYNIAYNDRTFYPPNDYTMGIDKDGVKCYIRHQASCNYNWGTDYTREQTTDRNSQYYAYSHITSSFIGEESITLYLLDRPVITDHNRGNNYTDLFSRCRRCSCL